jgi:cell division protein FtsB
MSLIKQIKTQAGQISIPVFAVALAGYFAYHAIQGERGLLAWITLKQDLKASQAQAAELASHRAWLEKRVALLNGDSLDLDMLEEQAMAMLNYGGKDDYIVFHREDVSDSDSQ